MENVIVSHEKSPKTQNLRSEKNSAEAWKEPDEAGRWAQEGGEEGAVVEAAGGVEPCA